MEIYNNYIRKNVIATIIDVLLVCQYVTTMTGRTSAMKNSAHPEKRRRRGFTLLEALFVLVVAVVIISLSLLVYRQTRDSSRSNENLEEVIQIYDATVSIYTDAQAIWNDPSTIIDSTIVASSTLISKKYIKNGEIVTWAGVKINMGYGAPEKAPPGFFVELPGLDQEACDLLLVQSYGDNLSAIAVNGTNVIGRFTQHPGPADIALTTQTCKETNTIKMYFTP